MHQDILMTDSHSLPMLLSARVAVRAQVVLLVWIAIHAAAQKPHTVLNLE